MRLALLLALCGLAVAQTATKVWIAANAGAPGSQEANITKLVRVLETNGGDLVADAVKWFAQTANAVRGADEQLPWVALVNGGSVRASIPAGPISQQQVLDLVPFPDWLVAKRVKAADLLIALENGVSKWQDTPIDPAGRFPLVSGLRYVFDPTQPVGRRILAAKLGDGRKLLRDYFGEVVVVTNNFVAGGNDGYAILAAAPTVANRTNDGLPQIVGSYLARFSPVSPATDGRIANCLLTAGIPACGPAYKKALGVSMVWLTADQGQPRTPEAKVSYVVRRQETNLGNLIADSLLLTARMSWTRYPLPADLKGLPLVALFNAGTLQDSIPAGPVTVGKLQGALPYSVDGITIKRVTAAGLVAALNNGVSIWGTKQTLTDGRFPQVGGMKFAFDARTRRVLSVHLGNGAWLFGAPAPTKHHTPVVYTGDLLLITNNYVAEGGDGYAAIQASPTVYSQDGDFVNAAVARALQALPVPFSVGTQGRITIVKRRHQH
ncbi:hypothetical protein COHA_001328 [Chlorella ohadii]|uniref:5'-Nucleotidase C-terminal domain-containing protein n=1 Tax=Chlorella ohadii TaxID=2649997 RepID=A0AAD5DYS4_9CHLO|nr:hypothetical protein COHA_001328 [Chlorella ohadii]